MEKLRKVELVREKCGVSYEDACEALEACNYDVLDAIIWLERAGKTTKQSAHYSTASQGAPTQESTTPTQLAIAQSTAQGHRTDSRFEERMNTVWESLKNLIHAGLENTFVAEREGKRVLAIPVLFVILGIFLWGASLVLLIIGLFFGLRYHIEGQRPATVDVNDVMDRVADAAETIKNDFTGK